MPELTEKWRRHYFGDFAAYDRGLRETARSRQLASAQLAVSVSHHNLHRLMEVLELELGERRLADTRVPERVDDLVAVIRALDELVECNPNRPPQ